MLRPDPYELADTTVEQAQGEDRPSPRLAELLRRPAVLAAVTALVFGQVVMVLIMTMTPLHMTQHGHDELDSKVFNGARHLVPLRR